MENRLAKVCRPAARVWLFLGMALCGSVAIGQHAVWSPPPKDAPRTALYPKPDPGPQYQVLPGGAIYQRSAPVTPSKIVPDCGVGLPPGDPGIEHAAPARMLEKLPPVYSPGPRRLPPLADDRNAYFDPRSRPLMQDFPGMGPNGWTPPDPDVACGLDYVVGITNDDFTVWDRCGTELFTVDINTYLGVGTDFMLFDPKIVFDPWGNRWLMTWHKKKVSTQEAALVLVITSGPTPFGLPGAGAFWYTFNMVQNAGTGDASWNDYYDLGYSPGYVFASGNQFRFSDSSFRWGRMVCWDKAQIYPGDAAAMLSFSNLPNPDGSALSTPRSVKMQAGWSEGGATVDALYINSRSGGGDKLTLRKLTDAFGTNTMTAADISTSAYAAPPAAVQPGGLTLDTINCRLMTAFVSSDVLGANGIELFTGLTTEYGGVSRAHLFKINPVLNSLEWEIQFGASGLYYWFPCVVADFSGSAVWVFSRTGNSAGNEAEARYVDYRQGVFSSGSSLLHDGTGVYNGFRWGDYLGGGLDWGDYSANFSTPGRPSKMWIVGEYAAPSSWGTHVGATSVFTQGALGSVNPSAMATFTGPKGGPFTPSAHTYTLTNAGDTGIQLQVSGLPSWLDSGLTDTNADLYPDGGAIALSTNSAAESLGMGTYDATVTIQDCFNAGTSFDRSVRLVVQAPDLDVVSINAADGTYRPDSSLHVSGSYHNNGNVASGTFTANFYLSTNTTISIADELIGTRSYPSLAVGGTVNFSHNLTVPCLGDARWYVGVILTVTNENNTADNIGYDPVTISTEYCPSDFDKNCFVNGDDYDAFMWEFYWGRPAADFDGNGFVNGDDYDFYSEAFVQGC